MSIVSALWAFLFKEGAVRLEDHDMSVLVPSATSTSWSSTSVCALCINSISHEEFMTDVCTSCGQRMPYLGARYAATRKVVLKGAWRYHRHYNGVDYIFDRGKWLPLSEFMEN